MSLFIRCTIAAILLTPFTGCSKPLPRIEDYLGTYRIIKIDEGGEPIKTPVLNNIELTEEHYIYRFDRNGDNRFSAGEISAMTYDFGVDGENVPYIVLSDGDRRMEILGDDYYDLLLREGPGDGSGTTLYARKVIPSRDNLNYLTKKEKLTGEYGIIKFRENETILNIGNAGRIIIGDNEYTSEIDVSNDGRIDGEERWTSPYEFHREAEKSYLLINRDNTKVFPYKEDNFDLLLRRIDSYGNDVIMYLKRD